MKMKDFDPVEWIRTNLALTPSTAGVMYGQSDSLSGNNDPIIDIPFDAHNSMHFGSRGSTLDFASVVGAGRILDFGPGDGSPSLTLAPMCDEVVGVEGSMQRADICAANAQRLGIANSQFVFVPPGENLPFPDGSFDGAVAAWSLEQSPDLPGTLNEISRVLRPGAKFRFEPEPLTVYADGWERQIWGPSTVSDKRTAFTLFDRDIQAERAYHFAFLIDLSLGELQELFAAHKEQPSCSGLSESVLQAVRSHVVSGQTWTTQHPSAANWFALLAAAGFSATRLTWSGRFVAGQHIEKLSTDAERPDNLSEVDAYLDPVIAKATDTDVPLEHGFHDGPLRPNPQTGPISCDTRITATR